MFIWIDFVPKYLRFAFFFFFFFFFKIVYWAIFTHIHVLPDDLKWNLQLYYYNLKNKFYIQYLCNRWACMSDVGLAAGNPLDLKTFAANISDIILRNIRE